MLRNFATTTEVCGRPEFLNEVLSLNAQEFQTKPLWRQADGSSMKS